jgi:hypothetical protein
MLERPNAIVAEFPTAHPSLGHGRSMKHPLANGSSADEVRPAKTSAPCAGTGRPRAQLVTRGDCL